MSSSSQKPLVTPAESVTVDLSPALWSSKMLPQKLQAGDPYRHIGDAYSRNQHTADQWEIKDP